MKLAVLTSVTLLLACFAYQCSPSSTTVNDSANRSGNLSGSAETQSVSEDLKVREDVQNWYEATLVELKRGSAKLRINNLREGKADSGPEIRIWVGFGLAYPSCFVLKNAPEKREAFYVGARVVGNRAVMDAKGKILPTKVVLSTPRSGWNEFDTFLKEHGIDSPLGLASDHQYVAVPDGQDIVVEVKSGNAYSMVFFSLYTKSEDGQKALEVCRRIEQEFGIRMGCENVDPPAQ